MLVNWRGSHKASLHKLLFPSLWGFPFSSSRWSTRLTLSEDLLACLQMKCVRWFRLAHPSQRNSRHSERVTFVIAAWCRCQSTFEAWWCCKRRRYFPKHLYSDWYPCVTGDACMALGRSVHVLFCSVQSVLFQLNMLYTVHCLRYQLMAETGDEQQISFKGMIKFLSLIFHTYVAVLLRVYPVLSSPFILISYTASVSFSIQLTSLREFYIWNPFWHKLLKYTLEYFWHVKFGNDGRESDCKGFKSTK